MKRYGLKFRLNTYQEFNWYRLGMIARKAVAPGERYSKVVMDSRLCTPIFLGGIMTPVLVQQWLFYVPNRLLWDQWVDFIALDDSVTAVPLTNVEAPVFFDGATASPQRNVFARRAYKRIYNEYFGDEFSLNGAGAQDAWFPNVDDDANRSLMPLLIWDQYRSHLRERAYSPATYTASVSGANATIVLDDLSRAIRANNTRRRQKMTGDKYVDTMRLMGVELDWRVQMAPEFLGSSQQIIWPTERSSTVPGTDGSDFAKRAFSYEAQAQFVLKRPVAFAEHGILVALMGCRPMIAMDGRAQDSTMYLPTDFYRADTLGGPMEVAESAVGSEPAVYAERNARYNRGMNLIGTNANGYVMTNPGPSIGDVYPLIAQPQPIVSGANQISVLTDFSVGGLTPVPSGRA